MNLLQTSKKVKRQGTEQINEEWTTEEVVQKAVKKEHETCEKAVDLFLAIYGAHLGDLLLLYLPRGGAYIIGTLSIALSPLMTEGSSFFEGVYNKGKMSTLAKEFPIVLITNMRTALKGAIEYARRVIENLE